MFTRHDDYVIYGSSRYGGDRWSSFTLCMPGGERVKVSFILDEYGFGLDHVVIKAAATPHDRLTFVDLIELDDTGSDPEQQEVLGKLLIVRNQRGEHRYAVIRAAKVLEGLAFCG